MPGAGAREAGEMVKRYKLPVLKDLMDSVEGIVNNTVL